MSELTWATAVTEEEHAELVKRRERARRISDKRHEDELKASVKSFKARNPMSESNPRIISDREFYDLEQSGFCTKKFISYSKFLENGRTRHREEALRKMEERKNGPKQHQGVIPRNSK